MSRSRESGPRAGSPGGFFLRLGAAGLRSRAWWIAAGYAVFASLWIYFSDQALGLLVSDPEQQVRWSVCKDIGFVAVTAILLFLLIRRDFGTIEAGYALYKAKAEQLRGSEAHEEEIDRLKRLYAALSHINQAIVRTPTRDELFAKVCRALVEHGGFRLAWIGWHDPATRMLVPVAEWGDENGYLKSIRVSAEDDRPEGQGPSGAAFRGGRPYISNDLLADPATLPWRPEIERRGLRASAVFPIREREKVVGVLNVQSGEAGFFQDQEIALLTEAAVDISFALDNLLRQAERRQAEATVRTERQFSDTIIESMPGILYFFDTRGKFLRWNRNFETVSGFSGAEIARMHPLDFFAGADKPRVEERIGEVFIHGESSVEASFVAKDGRATPYFFTGRSVTYEGRDCLVGLGIDLSELRQAEAALVRAEAADRIKSAFLATMSHELRTPLNSIIGFTGIVLQGLAGPLNAEQTKQLGMVRGSARHLLDLINDVLDISKIEAGQLEIRTDPFALPGLIEHAVASVRPLADKKGLALTAVVAPELGPMVSDRRRVEQILLNLLNNALKFTERGGVTLTATRVADYRPGPSAGPRPAVRLVVSDTGIGIRPADLATLFQPFRQIDTGLSRQHEGTGLGLAICRRLASLLEGEIAAKSVWSHGSEFTLILPLELNRTP